MDENNKFKIPDSTYSIPLEEFFRWYDEIISKQWKGMSDVEKIKYFEDKDLEKIKNKATAELKRNGLKDVPLKDIQASFDRPLNPEKGNANRIYYRIMEFQRLENDAELLQAMVKKFISQKAIDKMLSQDGAGEAMWGSL